VPVVGRSETAEEAVDVEEAEEAVAAMAEAGVSPSPRFHIMRLPWLTFLLVDGEEASRTEKGLALRFQTDWGLCPDSNWFFAFGMDVVVGVNAEEASGDFQAEVVDPRETMPVEMGSGLMS